MEFFKKLREAFAGITEQVPPYEFIGTRIAADGQPVALIRRNPTGLNLLTWINGEPETLEFTPKGLEEANQAIHAMCVAGVDLFSADGGAGEHNASYITAIRVAAATLSPESVAKQHTAPAEPVACPTV